eukprot:scaffold38481_cov84-Phaeocystis_antarctica.AAC.1
MLTNTIYHRYHVPQRTSDHMIMRRHHTLKARGATPYARAARAAGMCIYLYRVAQYCVCQNSTLTPVRLCCCAVRSRVQPMASGCCMPTRPMMSCEYVENALSSSDCARAQAAEWLDRAPEALAERPVARPLALGVLSCPEPPGARRGDAGAELGHCPGELFGPAAMPSGSVRPCSRRAALTTAPSDASDERLKPRREGPRRRAASSTEAKSASGVPAAAEPAAGAAARLANASRRRVRAHPRPRRARSDLGVILGALLLEVAAPQVHARETPRGRGRGRARARRRAVGASTGVGVGGRVAVAARGEAALEPADDSGEGRRGAE